MEDLVKRSAEKLSIAWVCAKWQVLFLLLLIATVVDNSGPTNSVSVLTQLGLSRDLLLRFREPFILISAFLGYIGSWLLDEYFALERLKEALVKNRYRLKETELMTARWSGLASSLHVHLDGFLKEPGYRSDRWLSSLLLHVGEATILVLSVVGLYAIVHILVLIDMVKHPSEPAWLSYCLLAVVILADFSALSRGLLTASLRRRVVYSSKMTQAVDLTISDLRKRMGLDS